ncbi:MAG: plastocyanin/azurin family copper-binding protein [Gemmatimonadota bacterium]
MIAFAACSGDNGSSLTSPGSGGGNGGGYGNGGGGTGGTGGTGGNTGGTPASGDVAVIVGNNFMKSGHNGSVNPAVDTVAIGGSVTWTWTNTGNVPHGIQSLGSPLFRNGTVLTGNGSTYRVTFNTAGTYQYDCVVHGAMMSGTIVVQ